MYMSKNSLKKDYFDEIDNMDSEQRVAFKDGYYAREKEEKEKNLTEKDTSYANGFKKGYYNTNDSEFNKRMEMINKIPVEERIAFKDGIEAKKRDDVRDSKLENNKYFDVFHKGHQKYSENEKKGGRKRKYKKTPKKGGKKKSRKQKKSRKSKKTEQ